jgi:hypothetical protein
MQVVEDVFRSEATGAASKTATSRLVVALCWQGESIDLEKLDLQSNRACLRRLKSSRTKLRRAPQ